MREFFAWPMPTAMPPWWSWRGVLLSLSGAAGLWSAGSYLGWFDVGRFRTLRPAVLVLVVAAMLVVSDTASKRAEIEAAERAASGWPGAP